MCAKFGSNMYNPVGGVSDRVKCVFERSAHLHNWVTKPKTINPPILRMGGLKSEVGPSPGKTQKKKMWG